MTLDLVLLAAVALFALWGAFTGAARQIAQAVAVFVAWLGSKFLSMALGPFAASQLKVSLLAGTIITALFSFFIVFLFVRWALQSLILRMIAGKEMKDRAVDRSLGAILGGGKVAAMAWVVLCALSFLENNVSIAGTRIDIAPKDSVAVQLSRRFNLFELAQFGGAGELVDVARAAADPKKSSQVRSNPTFEALKKDPRFAAALGSPAMKRAIQSGDTRSLLEDSSVLKLLQDPAAVKRLAELSDQIERY